jgi:hypothetical protein
MAGLHGVARQKPCGPRHTHGFALDAKNAFLDVRFRYAPLRHCAAPQPASGDVIDVASVLDAPQ